MYTVPSLPASKTLVLLGEAPGEEEQRADAPFVGPSGSLLRKTIFPAAGLDIEAWHITNVFQQRPPNNQLAKNWCATKTEHKKLGLTPIGQPIEKRYLLPEYWPQVHTTRDLLRSLQPDLIVALGGKAQWLLSGDDRIGTFRGTFFESPYGTAISTFHPAAALREYKMVPIITMDLIKVRTFIEGTLPTPLARTLIVNPSFDEIEETLQLFHNRPHEPIGVDIETWPSIAQMTTISFSFPDYGICIPIFDKNAPPPRSYWPDVKSELRAWKLIDAFCQLPNPKVLQNGLYDAQYMLDAPLPLRMAGDIEDTSIMQHAYQPELPKALGNLASYYLNEPSWKQMRSDAKEAKADD